MSPLLVVEFSRRNVDPDVRPSFQEIEDVVRGRSAAAAEQQDEEAAAA
jgi:hypothetical protein